MKNNNKELVGKEALEELTATFSKAKRNPCNLRYDLLDWTFIEALAKIAQYGAVTYGEGNWRKSRLEGDKSPINHIAKHIKQYLSNEQYDHTEVGLSRKYQLAAIAFNAMMEWYYENELGEEED